VELEENKEVSDDELRKAVSRAGYKLIGVERE